MMILLKKKQIHKISVVTSKEIKHASAALLNHLKSMTTQIPK